jgi:hypothetical protein
MGSSKQTKDFRQLPNGNEGCAQKGKYPEREGAWALGGWEEGPALKSCYELLGLLRSRCWSADSVIQRLHSWQLKV